MGASAVWLQALWVAPKVEQCVAKPDGLLISPPKCALARLGRRLRALEWIAGATNLLGLHRRLCFWPTVDTQ